MDKLTAWFERGIRPVNVGVYETEHGYQYWDGWQWSKYAQSPKYAEIFKSTVSLHQSNTWRGLVVKL